MRKIPRSVCIRTGCNEQVHFKRLCKAHYDVEYPGEPVRQYKFRWQVVERFEGSVRATSREEALRLAYRGVIAGTRINPDQKPGNVELLEDRECK